MATGWTNSKRRQQLPPNWPNIRAQVLRRDPTCVHCHNAPATDADHIGDPNHHGLSNLQGLCHPCHQTKTNADREAARPRRQRPAEQHPGMI